MKEKECRRRPQNNPCEEEVVHMNSMPFGNDLTDDELDEYIENARCEYYNEWWKYVEEDAE